MSISSLTSAIKAKETAIGEKVTSSKAVSVYWPGIKARTGKIPVSRNIMLLLGVGIFAICLALLVNAYVAQVNEHDELSDELASVEAQTATISADELLLLQSIDEADAQIAELDSQIIAAQAQLTRPMWVSGIFHDLLAVANDHGVVITDGVDITDISSAIQGNETIGGVPYHAVSVNMNVAGTDSNIYAFVDDLSQAFNTGVLNSMQITITEDPLTDSSANMLFTVYSL